MNRWWDPLRDCSSWDGLQELDFLETYLSIEQTRFQKRLCTKITADGEARTALIPTLLLQSLVENAVRHGIAHALRAAH